MRPHEWVGWRLGHAMMDLASWLKRVGADRLHFAGLALSDAVTHRWYSRTHPQHGDALVSKVGNYRGGW